MWFALLVFLARQWSYYIDFPDFVHTSSGWKVVIRGASPSWLGNCSQFLLQCSYPGYASFPFIHRWRCEVVNHMGSSRVGTIYISDARQKMDRAADAAAEQAVRDPQRVFELDMLALSNHSFFGFSNIGRGSLWQEIVQQLCLPFFSWHRGDQAFLCCLVQSAFRKEPQLILCSSRLASSVAVKVPRHLAAGPTMMQCNSAYSFLDTHRLNC